MQCTRTCTVVVMVKLVQYAAACIDIYLVTGGTSMIRTPPVRGLLQLCVYVCLCPSAGANLGTGASRRLTEGTSGLSGRFFTIIKRCFL